MKKEYIGDGVYVEIENGMFKVTTEDGIEVTNTIFFDLQVFEALLGYAKRVREDEDGPTTCPDCLGTGTDAPAKDRRCLACNGSGRTPGTTGRQTCDPCKGTGVGTGAADGAPDSPPSIAEYPREIVCEGCGEVVAFARAHVKTEDTIRAIDLVKPDGSHYKQFDFVCDNCHAAGPFTARDRPRKCLHCGGSGVEIGFPDDDAPNPPPCPCCKGTGEIPG